jgi:hypothetical protein
MTRDDYETTTVDAAARLAREDSADWAEYDAPVTAGRAAWLAQLGRNGTREDER